MPTHPSLYGDIHHERGKPYSAVRREGLREEIPQILGKGEVISTGKGESYSG